MVITDIACYALLHFSALLCPSVTCSGLAYGIFCWRRACHTITTIAAASPKTSRPEIEDRSSRSALDSGARVEAGIGVEVGVSVGDGVGVGVGVDVGVGVNVAVGVREGVAVGSNVVCG